MIRLVRRLVFRYKIYWSMVRSFCGREATLTEQSPAGGGEFTAGVASGFPCRLLPPRPRTAEVSTWPEPSTGLPCHQKTQTGCRQQKPTQLLSTCAFSVSSVRASGDASEVGVPKVCFYELMITGFGFTVTLFRHWIYMG